MCDDNIRLFPLVRVLKVEMLGQRAWAFERILMNGTDLFPKSSCLCPFHLFALTYPCITAAQHVGRQFFLEPEVASLCLRVPGVWH